MSSRKFYINYLIVLCIYAAQGVFYYLTFFHLPVFFAITQHGISNLMVVLFFLTIQLPYLIKIVFGFIEDRNLLKIDNEEEKYRYHHSIRRKYFILGLLSFIPIATLTSIIYPISLILFLILFFISHFGLYLLDATIDGIVSEQNRRDRLKLVAIMQAGSTIGGHILIMSFSRYVSSAPEKLSSWSGYFFFSITLSIVFVSISSLFLLTKPNEDQTESYLKQENALPKKEGFFIIEGHYVKKRVYLRKILPLVIILAFLLDIDNIADVITEQSIIIRLGQEAFNMLNYFMTFLILIRYLSIIITIIIADKFENREYKLLFITWMFVLFYWSGFMYLNIEGLIINYGIIFFVAPFFIMSFTYIFIKFTPEEYHTTGFQIIYFFYVLAEIILPSVGLVLSQFIGFNGVFMIILIVGGLAFLLIYILNKIDENIRLDKYA